jgi:LmbE family N-acetylglucosaminyl deacetylase
MQHEPAIKPPFRILVVVAHPDDIEFGISGSVAVWTQAGAAVTYCIVTDGAAGSNDALTNLEQLVEQRQQEQIEAARIVGVEDVRFLHYHDGSLEPTIALRRDLTRVIRQVRPDRVVLMDPTVIFVQDDENGFYYINHPDHRAAAEAALYAVFPSAETRPIFPELLAEELEPHHVNELYLSFSEKPNVVVDISSTLELKIKSLLVHRSQVDEGAAEMVRGWAKEEGAAHGVEYAESFRVMRFYPETPGKESPAE